MALPDEETQRLLKEVCDFFDKEDRAVRERQIRTWKRLKYFWNGLQRIYWSETAHDWRTFDAISLESVQASDNAYYDKPINIFKAYLESIIAALSVTVPSIYCAPDDADNPLDISTAKAGNKIAELVFKHNDAPLLWLHALYILCTEGMVAAYSYPKEDEKYGTYEEEQKEPYEIEQQQKLCPNCGNPIMDDALAIRLSDQERDEYMPGDDDAGAHDLLDKYEYICPSCLAQVDPAIQTERIIVERVIGITRKPKSRQCIEVYGGLFVKVPNYAMKQEDCPYLILSYDCNYVNVLERYEHLRDKVDTNGKITSGGGVYDPYEKWGRLSTQYLGEYPINTVTVRNNWLRPCAFQILRSDEDVKKLKKKYPDGAKVVMINDVVADAENEALDDCWTITKHPLSDYIHFDPLGLSLTSIQEITNDLTSLVLQTIEHGIPQTFADPSVLDFESYRQMEASPGAIYPAKPSSGKQLGEAFYEVKTATLSAEVQPFAQRLQEMGQLVSGALPSLFGGAAPNSSKTAAQYAMSRAQALQRLQNTWKMLTYWWKDIFGKVIPAYIENVVEDERYVSKDEGGNFINVFIRKAELQGKIGSIELEGDDQLPATWTQKKDVIMQLLQGNNPEVLAALASPENLPLLAAAIGLDDFNLPGEDDRQKQYEEIRQLMDSEPTQIPPNPMMVQQAMMTGMQPPQPQTIPSVPVDPLIDNHQVEAEVCRHFLISDAGRLAKTENPTGYQNVLLHMRDHVMQIQMQAMNQQMSQSPGGPGAQKNNPPQNENQQGGDRSEQSPSQRGNPAPAAAKPRAANQAALIQ